MFPWHKLVDLLDHTYLCLLFKCFFIYPNLSVNVCVCGRDADGIKCSIVKNTSFLTFTATVFLTIFNFCLACYMSLAVGLSL